MQIRVNHLHPAQYLLQLILETYQTEPTSAFYQKPALTEFAQCIGMTMQTHAHPENSENILLKMLEIIQHYSKSISARDQRIVGRFFADFQSCLLKLDSDSQQRIKQWMLAEIRQQLVEDLKNHRSGFPPYLHQILPLLHESDLVKLREYLLSQWHLQSNNQLHGLSVYDDELIHAILTINSHLKDLKLPDNLLLRQMTRKTYNKNSLSHEDTAKKITRLPSSYLLRTLQLLEQERKPQIEYSKFLSNSETTFALYESLCIRDEAEAIEFEEHFGIDNISRLFTYTDNDIEVEEQILCLTTNLLGFVSPDTREKIFTCLLDKLAFEQLFEHYDLLNKAEQKFLADKFIWAITNKDNNEDYYDHFAFAEPLQEFKLICSKEPMHGLIEASLDVITRKEEKFIKHALHALALAWNFLPENLYESIIEVLANHAPNLSHPYQQIISSIFIEALDKLSGACKLKVLSILINIEIDYDNLSEENLNTLKCNLPEGNWHVASNRIIRLALHSSKDSDGTFLCDDTFENLIELNSEEEDAAIFNSLLSEIEKIDLKTFERALHLINLIKDCSFDGRQLLILLKIFLSHLSELETHLSSKICIDLMKDIKVFVTAEENIMLKREIFSLFAEHYYPTSAKDTLTAIVFNLLKLIQDTQFDGELTMQALSIFMNEGDTNRTRLMLPFFLEILRLTEPTNSVDILEALIMKTITLDGIKDFTTPEFIKKFELQSPSDNNGAKHVCGMIVESLIKVREKTFQATVTVDDYSRIHFLEKLLTTYLNAVDSEQRFEIIAALPNTDLLIKKILFLINTQPEQSDLELDLCKLSIKEHAQPNLHRVHP